MKTIRVAPFRYIETPNANPAARYGVSVLVERAEDGARRWENHNGPQREYSYWFGSTEMRNKLRTEVNGLVLALEAYVVGDPALGYALSVRALVNGDWAIQVTGQPPLPDVTECTQKHAAWFDAVRSTAQTERRKRKHLHQLEGRDV